jgi:hypothetical protein
MSELAGRRSERADRRASQRRERAAARVSEVGHRRTQTRAKKPWILGGSMLLLACVGGYSAPRPALLPVDQVARRQSLEQLARMLFDAMKAQSPQRALAHQQDLDALLPVSSRALVERERHAQADRGGRGGAFPGPWSQASYAGFCVQGAREVAPGGALELDKSAWQLDRVLVVAALGQARSAAWVEGRFLFTDQGWRTLSLTRIEPPRAGHSDLELAPCDVEQGIR